jgi:hypothetical protein
MCVCGYSCRHADTFLGIAVVVSVELHTSIQINDKNLTLSWDCNSFRLLMWVYKFIDISCKAGYLSGWTGKALFMREIYGILCNKTQWIVFLERVSK